MRWKLNKKKIKKMYKLELPSKQLKILQGETIIGRSEEWQCLDIKCSREHCRLKYTSFGLKIKAVRAVTVYI